MDIIDDMQQSPARQEDQPLGWVYPGRESGKLVEGTLLCKPAQLARGSWMPAFPRRRVVELLGNLPQKTALFILMFLQLH